MSSSAYRSIDIAATVMWVQSMYDFLVKYGEVCHLVSSSSLGRYVLS